MASFTGTGLELDSEDAKSSKTDPAAVKSLSNAISRARSGQGSAAAEHTADALVSLCEQFGLNIYDYLRG